MVVQTYIWVAILCEVTLRESFLSSYWDCPLITERHGGAQGFFPFFLEFAGAMDTSPFCRPPSKNILKACVRNSPQPECLDSFTLGICCRGKCVAGPWNHCMAMTSERSFFPPLNGTTFGRGTNAPTEQNMHYVATEPRFPCGGRRPCRARQIGLHIV